MKEIQKVIQKWRHVARKQKVAIFIWGGNSN